MKNRAERRNEIYGNELDLPTLRVIQQMLNDLNPYVNLFKQPRDLQNVESIAIRISRDPNLDLRR